MKFERNVESIAFANPDREYMKKWISKANEDWE